MPFTKGNQLGRKFSKDNQPAPENRSGGRIDRVGQFLASIKVKPLTQDEITQIDTALLTMTREELCELVKDPKQPVVIQARAKQLIEKKTTFEGCEKLLDRSFGKPTIRTESTVDADGINVTFNRGDGKPARTTEDDES